MRNENKGFVQTMHEVFVGGEASLGMAVEAS